MRWGPYSYPMAVWIEGRMAEPTTLVAADIAHDLLTTLARLRQARIDEDERAIYFNQHRLDWLLDGIARQMKAT